MLCKRSSHARLVANQQARRDLRKQRLKLRPSPFLVHLVAYGIRRLFATGIGALYLLSFEKQYSAFVVRT